MDLKEIEKILKNEPPFRLKQVEKSIFKDLIESWEEATTLPQNLREKLAAHCSLQELTPEKVLTSKAEHQAKAEKRFISSKDNQTIKALFRLSDNSRIEAVLMKHEDNRRTVCVSSQVGCAMNCQFCATGQQGFKRNLTAGEIIDQVLFFARLLKKTNERVSSIVFMGMGEPFLNYDNVLAAIKILNAKDGLNIGARHISISTCGITEGIAKLAKENLEINLAVSLHAPTNELRQKLMPINKKYPIEKVLSGVADYIKKNKRRVMLEYLMIDNLNDSPICVKKLALLLKKMKNKLFFVNLISFNPVGHSEFKPSSGDKIRKFKEILEQSGIACTQRYRFGKEIKAACGQLAGKS